MAVSLVQAQIEIRLGERRSEVRRNFSDSLRRFFMGAHDVQPRLVKTTLPPKEHR